MINILMHLYLMIRSFKWIHILLVLVLLVSAINCSKKPTPPEVIPDPVYKTENVIIIMIDGPRYTETWGDPTHSLIPKRYALLKQGVLCNAMYNMGTTSTVPGHIAITTGFYQHIPNDGTEYPAKPSFFQYWLQTYKQPSSKAWVIATKDKLEVLSDCLDAEWKGKYKPSTDCGIAGLGTGQRNDGVTVTKVLSILDANHPQLVLINFRQPDVAAHGADSAGYIKGIVDTDGYVDLFWKHLQNDAFYKDKTTMIVANDHGRHTAGHLDGYVSHGDTCDGCKHIEMFAIGPDFKSNYISNVTYEQIDITSTVAALMKIKMPSANGKIISDIFKN